MTDVSAPLDRPSSEEAFRQEVLTFLRGHAAGQGRRGERRRLVRWLGTLAFGRLPAPAGRRGPGRHHVAGRVRRARAPRPLPAHLRPRVQGLQGPAPLARDRARHVRADAAGARQRGAEEGVHPAAAARRPRLVRAVQRARRGLGPLERADAGPARRRRVRAPGPEGVDVGRAAQRLRRLPRADRPGAAQARGHHHADRRHARAGRHGAAAAPDHRRVPLQRGLPGRGAGAGGQRGGRPSTTAGAWPAPCSPSNARPWATWAAGAAARAASPRWPRRRSGATWPGGPSCATAWCSCASARWSCATSPATCR